VDVPAFAIDAYNVTNKEYLRFVHEGATAIARCGVTRVGNISHRKDAHIQSSGNIKAIRGTAGQCSTKFRCRPTGRST